jgi:hypothetical protein
MVRSSQQKLREWRPFVGRLARWLGATVKEFLTTIPQYPFQEGSSMNPSNVNYMTLKAAAALHQLEMMSHPHN